MQGSLSLKSLPDLHTKETINSPISHPRSRVQKYKTKTTILYQCTANALQNPPTPDHLLIQTKADEEIHFFCVHLKKSSVKATSALQSAALYQHAVFFHCFVNGSVQLGTVKVC